MFKIVVAIVAVIGLSYFFQQRGVHHSLLANVNAQHALRVFGDQFQVEILVDFAPLPERDRALIKNYCLAVYGRYQLLKGSKSILKPDDEPVCQALIRGGWKPNWTIADGLAFVRDPVNYTH